MQESKDSFKACFENVNIVNLIEFNFLPGLQTRYLKKSSIWDAPFLYPQLMCRISKFIIHLQKIPLDTTCFLTQKSQILYHATSDFGFRMTILHILPMSDYFCTVGLNPKTDRNLNQILRMSILPLFLLKNLNLSLKLHARNEYITITCTFRGFFSAFWEHDPTCRIGNICVVSYKIGKKLKPYKIIK